MTVGSSPNFVGEWGVMFYQSHKCMNEQMHFA